MEIRDILRTWGYESERTAQLQTGGHGADVDGIPGVHLEVKRQERIEIEKWCRQAEADAARQRAPGRPVTAWRRSREPWRVSLTLEDFLTLIDRP